MAETRLPRDVATASWATQTLVVTAGSETVTDSFYVDKGVYGPKRIRAAVSFPTPGTAVQVDLQVSQGGVIWHTIYALTNFDGDTIEFPAPQGFFRFRAVSFTGAPTCSITLTALGIAQSRLVLGSIGPTIGGVTEGAAVQIGSAAAPIVQDTANTAFVSMNFVNDATTGSIRGMRITLDAGGTLQTYTKAANFIINETAHVRNPVVVKSDLNCSADSFVQGSGALFGGYVGFPASVFPSYGAFGGIDLEFNAPASCSHNTGGFPQVAFLRFSLGGDGTAITSLETGATTAGGRLCFLSLQGFTEGAGRMVRIAAPTTAAASLRVMIGTTYYYLGLFSTQN